MNPEQEGVPRNIAERLSANQLLQVGSSGPIYVQRSPSMNRAEVPHMLPGGVGRVIGRSHLLKAMDDAMGSSGSRCCVLWGLAGAGKTTLALAWSGSRLENYPDGQFFVDMQAYSNAPRVEPRDALRTFLAALGVSRSDLHDDTGWGNAFLSATAGKRCLVIIDNVSTYDDVRELVPGVGSSLIVTSRRAVPELIIRHQAQVLKLPLLSIEEGIELLAERVGFVRVGKDNHSATRIVELLEGHPLALAIVAAKLAVHTTWDLQDALAGIQSGDTPLRFLDDADLGIEVGRVVSWSVEDLDPETKYVLYAASMLPNTELSSAVLRLVLDQDESRCDRTLRALSLASLIDEISRGHYRMHDIIRAYLSETRTQVLNAEQQIDIARRIRITYLALSFAADQAIDPNRSAITLGEDAQRIAGEVRFTVPEALTWFSAITPSMVRLMDEASDTHDYEFVTRFAWCVNTYLYWRQDIPKTLEVQERALQAALAGDHPMEAHCRRGLGRALADAGRLSFAKEQLLAALSIESARGDSSQTASTQHAMAELSLRSGSYAQALRWGLRAARESRRNNNAVREARGLYDAARALIELGRYTWAEDLGLRSLAICEERANAYGRALALRVLGTVGVKSGDLEKGCTWLERAWRAEEALGNSRSVRAILRQLEYAYTQVGNDNAVAEVHRVLRDLDRFVSTDEPR
ncbi:NB-ARC domain-containing protein [Streptomyces sp. NPDC047706]|uniref:NB-ARC domain-containing protein n=1 Tax=Streptomyces sp. NPDC047706 TaxID=3365486 RepID=UPI00371EB1FC